MGFAVGPRRDRRGPAGCDLAPPRLERAGRGEGASCHGSNTLVRRRRVGARRRPVPAQRLTAGGFASFWVCWMTSGEAAAGGGRFILGGEPASPCAGWGRAGGVFPCWLM